MPIADIDDREPGWEDYCVSYELQDARVVAILHGNGGAVVEEHAVLNIVEGRLASHVIDDRGTVTQLDYQLLFNVQPEFVSTQFTTYPASIVIRGTAPNGRLFDIRGTGWIGQDEHGQLDGHFDRVPMFYTPAKADLAEHLEQMAEKNGWEPGGDFILASYGQAQDRGIAQGV